MVEWGEDRVETPAYAKHSKTFLQSFGHVAHVLENIVERMQSKQLSGSGNDSPKPVSNVAAILAGGKFARLGALALRRFDTD